MDTMEDEQKGVIEPIQVNNDEEDLDFNKQELKTG